MHGELCAWLAWKLLGHQPPQVIPKHRARDTQCHSFSSQAQHLKIDFISFICSTFVSRWRVQVAMQCTGHLWTFTLTHFALLGKGKAERSLQTQFQVQRKKIPRNWAGNPKSAMSNWWIIDVDNLCPDPFWWVLTFSTAAAWWIWWGAGHSGHGPLTWFSMIF